MSTIKMGRRSVMGLALGTAAAAATRPARAAGTLVMVGSGNYPPYNLATADDRIQGIYADVMTEICNRTSLTLDYRAVPWRRAQLMVQQGTADGFITTPSDERRSYCSFVAEPLFETNVAVAVYRADGPLVGRIESARSIDDLRSFSLVDYGGNSRGEAWFAGWDNVHWANDFPTMLRMIQADHAGLTVQPREVVAYHARLMGMVGVFAYHQLADVDGAVRFNIGIRKSYPDVETVIARFAQIQTELRQSNFLARVVANYT